MSRLGNIFHVRSPGLCLQLKGVCAAAVVKALRGGSARVDASIPTSSGHHLVASWTLAAYLPLCVEPMDLVRCALAHPRPARSSGPRSLKLGQASRRLGVRAVGFVLSVWEQGSWLYVGVGVGSFVFGILKRDREQPQALAGTCESVKSSKWRRQRGALTSSPELPISDNSGDRQTSCS